MAATYKLERAGGRPAEPASIRSAVYSWRAGDTIPVGANLTLRVIGTRLDEGTEGEPITVLVVEPVA